MPIRPTSDRTGYPIFRRGHASLILDNPARMAKAEKILKRVIIKRDTNKLDEIPHRLPHKKGILMQRNRTLHLPVCIDYIQMDLFDVAFLMANPDYPKPWTTSAYSTCGELSCIEPTHLKPGCLLPWNNQHGDGGYLLLPDGTILDWDDPDDRLQIEQGAIACPDTR